jgi:hypothetical protein
MSADQQKSKGGDDLDAVRAVVAALEGFEPKDQERIIRWAREKIGLASSSPSHPPAHHSPPPPSGTHTPPAATPGRPTDIKSFIADKAPQSDYQFVAAVAYYYRFEAPEPERKLDISPDDIQEAARKVGRNRFKTPAQTLVNAHNQGYFDKAERGRYALNTVGENLVAMALPQAAAASNRPASQGRRRTRKKAKG